MNNKIKLACFLVSIIATWGTAPAFADDDWETKQQETFNTLQVLAFDVRIKGKAAVSESKDAKPPVKYATTIVELSLNRIKDLLTRPFSQRTVTHLAYDVRDMMDYYVPEFYQLSDFVCADKLSRLNILLRQLTVETKNIVYNDLEKACKPLIETGNCNDREQFASEKDYKDNMADLLIRQKMGPQIETIVSLIEDILNNDKHFHYL